MSKNLFMFAVVDVPFWRLLSEITKSSTGVANEQDVALQVESVVYRALGLENTPDSIAFFRCLMDGWATTHEMLQPWIASARPRARALWAGFVETNLLVVNGRGEHLATLLPAVSKREMEGLCRNTLADYAIRAFLGALYDGLSFLEPTGGVLVVTARCVGRSMGDREYKRG